MSNVNNTIKWNSADDLGVAQSLDSIRRPGFYGMRSPLGLPDGDYHIMVMKGLEQGPGVQNVKQIAYDATGSSVLSRYFNGATWSSWVGSGGGSGTAVDLAISGRNATSFNLTATNDIGAGDPAAFPLATGSLAGLMSGADKAKLDSMPPGFVGVYATLAALQTAIPTSTNGYYATLLNPGSDPSFAVWDDDANDWVEASSVSVGTTNISVSSDGTTVTILSDTGTDGTIPSATPHTGGTAGTGGAAGVMSAADKTIIANFRIFNVLNYGAVSNDVDDTNASANRIAFENAILAANAAGAGVIYAPRGTYRISYGGAASVGGVRLRNNMTLAGDGIGATIIKAADIGNNDMAGVVRTQSGVINQNIIVRDLTIDGNKAGQTGWSNVICFFAGVTPDDRVNKDRDIWCLNVECRNGKNGTAGSSNLSRGYGFDPHEVVERFAAVNCIAHDNERDGFVLDGVEDFSLVGCKSWNNGRHGYNFITGTYRGFVQACHAWDNGDNDYVVQGDSHTINFIGCSSLRAGQNGFRIRRGATIINTFVVMSGCTVQEAARNGIQATGCAHNVISGNLFLNNSQDADNTYFDVSLDEDDGDTMTFTGAHRNIVSNNYSVALMANKAKAAYREDELATAPPYENTFSWNHAFGHVQAKYDDGISATSNIIDHGYLTVYDVKGHGIVGDNSTDNGTRLRSLVDLVEARGGGIIQMPAGIYLASGTGTASQGVVSLPSNVHLRGDGPGVTILRAIDPVNNSLTGIVRTRSGAVNQNISVSDMTIDAQTCTGTGDITSLYVGGTSDERIFFDNLAILGGQNGAGSTGYGARVTESATYVHFNSVIATSNEQDNFYVDGAADTWLRGCISLSAGRHGYNVSNLAAYTRLDSCRGQLSTVNNLFVSADAERVAVNGGDYSYAGQDNIRVRRGENTVSTRVDIRDAVISDAGRDGVSFAGCSHNSVRGCTFSNNGTSTNDTYSDVSFELDGTYPATKATDNFCLGNVHHAAPSGNKVDYFYAERTNAGDTNVVLWNHLNGTPASSNYLLAAASTTVFRDHTSGALAGGSDNQVQYNNGGALGGNAGLTIDEANNRPVATNGLVLGAPGSIVAPTAGQLAPVAAVRGTSIALPAYISARRHLLQNAMFDRCVGMFLPSSTGTTGQGINVAFTGTATVASVASTNKATSVRRVNVAAAAAASSASGVTQNSRNMWRGNAAGLGGFTISLMFSFPTTLTTPRFYAGLAAATSGVIVDSADPSAAINIFGVGVDEGQTTLRLLTNDGTGAAAATDLGANYPVTAGAFYEFFAHAEPNAANIQWYIRRLDSAFETGGTVSSDMPSSGTFLAMQIGVDTATTNEAASIDFHQMYFEVPIL